jgi:hypothetical protein
MSAAGTTIRIWGFAVAIDIWTVATLATADVVFPGCASR